MNRLAKAAILLVSLVAVFSFSQENHLGESVTQKGKVVVYDTVPVCRVIFADGVSNSSQAIYSTLMSTLSDLTVEVLKNSQTISPTSTVLILIVVLVFLYMISVKKSDKKEERLINGVKQELNTLEKNIKECLEKNKNEIKTAVAGEIKNAIAEHEKK